ncbi:hypothetical protein EYF80_040184 [Liparis tanakae]|uniref:Uncharacterized protein n=1 Tax=Liparis tanakae TaxID=230148 RepID=A0A4Z2G7S3_9TELE|nr:hypothetical protein EYF80_040184 [Liparis tanakae]
MIERKELVTRKPRRPSPPSPGTRGLSEEEGLRSGLLLLKVMKRCWQNSSGSSLSRNVCMKSLKPSKRWKTNLKVEQIPANE